MKAFTLAMIALIGITLVSVAGLGLFTTSAEDAYVIKSNVRR